MSTNDRGSQLQAALQATKADLLAYLERRVSRREDAADLLGETMLQAWRRADALPEGEERQRMWLFTIAAHVLANERRAAGRHATKTERLRSLLRATVPEPDLGEQAAVRDAVRRLPPPQRELVMLVHWDRFSLVEAAEMLSMNASTARSRYAAARTALQRALGDPVACGRQTQVTPSAPPASMRP